MKFVVIISLFLLTVLSGCINSPPPTPQEIVSGQITKNIDTIAYSLILPETVFSNGTSKILGGNGVFYNHSVFHLFTTRDEKHTFMIEVTNDTKTLEDTLAEQSQDMGASDETKKIVFKGKDAVRLDRQYTLASTTFPIAPTTVTEQKATGIIFPNACGRYAAFWCTTINSTDGFCSSAFESLDFDCKK